MIDDRFGVAAAAAAAATATLTPRLSFPSFPAAFLLFSLFPFFFFFFSTAADLSKEHQEFSLQEFTISRYSDRSLIFRGKIKKNYWETVFFFYVIVITLRNILLIIDYC